jgi:hypothetical protein
MIVGMLPAAGGGLRALAATGQAPRLIDGYLRPYVVALGRVDYFTYAPERLEEFTRDPILLERVRVLAPARATPRAVRTLTLASSHATELAACAVLRVFQLTGAIPALIARARFGVPYVVTYGFWYARLSRPGPKRWLKGALERIGLGHAAAVIATTPELAARARRFASPPASGRPPGRRLCLLYRPALGRCGHANANKRPATTTRDGG